MDTMLKLGKQKVQQFIKFKSSEIIYLWEELLEIIAENEASDRAEHEMYEKRTDMKLLIRIIYGNIDYLQQFIVLNRKIEACLASVALCYVLPFKKDYEPPLHVNATPHSLSIDSDPRISSDSLKD